MRFPLHSAEQLDRALKLAHTADDIERIRAEALTCEGAASDERRYAIARAAARRLRALDAARAAALDRRLRRGGWLR